MKKTVILMMKIFNASTVRTTPRNPERNRRIDNGDHDFSKCCWICGKFIKEAKRNHWVHTIYGADILPVEMVCPPNEDSGFYPVGSECKKLIPEGYLFNGTYEDVLSIPNGR